jgi:hypothetical protein
METILKLNYNEANKFFLKQESYCSIDLPEYFVFQDLLNNLSKKISNKNFTDLCRKEKNGKNKEEPILPKIFEDVNYKFLTNKDGKYAWRPLQIINPAIYVYLVNIITKEENWNLIIERFKKFQENEKIKCFSIPIVVSAEENVSDKARSITNWWQQIEQQSLELALNYDCFLNTDITDCYSSIYTHTIEWALHGKEKSKENVQKKKNKREKFLGGEIDQTIESMQYGQTNGIPQGSYLMDFIAEIVLGYTDRILSCKIKCYNHKEQKYKIEDYQILRYRDDYRIFATNQETLVKIAKLLTETLIDLNLKLNSQKTFISDNIVRDVIKPDKLYWNEAKQKEKTLQKHLFLIHSLAEKYPNSGSLTKALDKFLDRIYSPTLFKRENTKVLVSILVDIAYKNPKTYPVITSILSKILSLEIDNKIKEEILFSIKNKFKKIPNVGHLQIWLQRLTIKIDQNKDYDEKLCKKIFDDTIQIWNIDWLNENIKGIFINTSVIDKQKIEDMPQIIAPKEVKIFNNKGYF